MYVIWNDQCQSVEAGEEGEGWPSYGAAASACGGAEMPAYHGPDGLVFGPEACARAEEACVRGIAREKADSARRWAVMASIAAQPVVVAAKPDRATTLAIMLARNEAALLACKKSDRAEITRLTNNIARLRAEMGVLA